MHLFQGLGDVPPDFGPSAVTIGKFDGVHAGHRAVIAELKSTAAELGLASTVVTFDRNPLAVVAPQACPVSLISNEQKSELLAGTGVDATLVLTFDKAFSEESPETFVTSVLLDALQARVVFVGSDFRFGTRGSGTVELLRTLGSQHGFEVRLIPEVTVGGARRASSTWIRELLESGNIVAATALLERPPSIRSVVVHGEKRGRELGYPTANLSPDLEGFIPADGVYAAWATVLGSRYAAAVSIGNNPTFEGVPQKRVEAHLLDVDVDLYGQPIELEFVDYVRSMSKFDSVDALVEQMHRDTERVRVVLSAAHR